MTKHSITLEYSSNGRWFVEQVQNFRAEHPSKGWKHFVRLNKDSMTLEATSKGAAK